MQSLQNHFLIATPDLHDSYFERTVTYICEHNEEGAMGLIINQPAAVNLTTLLEQIEIIIPSETPIKNAPVYTGGPVGTDRGFVLHTPQPGWRSSLKLSDEVMITTSKDILHALGSPNAPEQFLLTLGYAGWDAGQLEEELADNSWLTIPADAHILFDTPSKDRWQKAGEKLGIDIYQLAPGAGHA